MSNYANTKATIAANVYENHLNQVTANMAKAAMNSIVDALIAGGFLYKGVAIPTTNPGTPDANVFYIASTPGTYTNFGSLVVADGEVAILKYNGSWSKEVTGAATAAEVSALGHEVDEDYTEITGEIVTGPWEMGSMAPGSPHIPDYAANNRIRMPELVCQADGNYTITCASGYEFLIYVVGKITTATWSANRVVPLVAGDVFRLALRQDPAVDYSSYTQSQIDAVADAAGLKVSGPGIIPTQVQILDGEISELNGKVDGFHEVEEREDFVDVLIDKDRKILESRDASGAKTIYTDVELKKNLSVAGESVSKIENAEFVRALVDANEKILFAVRKDGSVFIPKLEAGNDVLFGKKWAVVGDSFTNGSASLPTIAGGKYSGKKQTYDYLIGNRRGMEIQHLAIGGRTLATPAVISSHNCFTDPLSALNYQNIAPDADYITIYLGINDSSNAPGANGGDGELPVGEIPLGTITDNTINTFYGAWNFILPYLIENFPFAHIGVIVSNGISDTTDYSDATKEAAEKWGIPWIDLNGDSRTPFMIRSNNTAIQQAVKDARNLAQAVNWGVDNHPNAAAHLFESYFIEQFLKTI